VNSNPWTDPHLRGVCGLGCPYCDEGWPRGSIGEPQPARSSPRRPLDHADLTCDWTPYAILGRAGFVHYDCLDCLTRTTNPAARLCPDRVKVAIENARVDGRREMREEAAAMCDDTYNDWLAEPGIRGSTERALTAFGNAGRKIRSIIVKD
jgi:hypothetical protein